MPRLIDADALPVHRVKILHAFGIVEGNVIFPEHVKNAPTIDAEHVRHGQWEYNPGDNIPYCNQCAMPQDVPTNYCHHCGAKMDGGDNNVPTNEPNKTCPINGAPCNECVPGAYCAKIDEGAEDA